MAVSLGDVIDGKYRVVRVVGEGGMGIVYEGEYSRIRRRVAIKVLNTTAKAEEMLTRFEREAQAAGRIGNEHIIEVYDIGTLPSGPPYMVTEFLDGTTLAQRIETQGPLPAPAIARVAAQILVALDAAHGAGIIHRDLKPDNVFILRQRSGIKDFVKLIDFGISKFESSSAEPGTLKVTRLGAVLGTPTYMSPEVARGTSEADARTDIYGLGVIMYEALSRRLPFESNNFNDLLFKIVEGSPPDLRSLVGDLDPDLSAMVMKAMARSSEDRFESAAQFLAVLTEWMVARGIGPLTASVSSVPSMEASDAARRDSRASQTARMTPAPNQHPASSPGQEAAAVGIMQSRGVTGPTGGAGDSIERAWAGTHSSKPKSGARIAIAGGGVVLAIGGAFGVFAMQTMPSTPTWTEASGSRSTPTTSATPSATVSSSSAPLSIPSDPPPTAAVTTDPAPSASTVPSTPRTKPWGPFTPPRPVTVTVPSVGAKPSASVPSAPKPPKGPDDEIPTMR